MIYTFDNVIEKIVLHFENSEKIVLRSDDIIIFNFKQPYDSFYTYSRNLYGNTLKCLNTNKIIDDVILIIKDKPFKQEDAVFDYKNKKYSDRLKLYNDIVSISVFTKQVKYENKNTKIEETKNKKGEVVLKQQSFEVFYRPFSFYENAPEISEIFHSDDNCHQFTFKANKEKLKNLLIIQEDKKSKNDFEDLIYISITSSLKNNEYHLSPKNKMALEWFSNYVDNLKIKKLKGKDK